MAQLKKILHCDDKRMFYVLKEEIEKTWMRLKNSNFEDKELLKQLNNDILEYVNYKNSVDE